MKFRIVLFALNLIFVVNSFSQQFTAISNTPYSPLLNLSTNPAGILQSKQKYSFNILTGELSIINNFFTLRPFAFTSLSSSIKNNDFSQPLNDIRLGRLADVMPPVQHYGNMDIQLFGLYRHVDRPGKKNYAFSLTGKYRNITNVQNLDRNLFNLYDLYSSGSINQYLLVDKIKNYNINMEDLNYTTHIFAELGLTFAGDIYKSTRHVVSGGITLKRLMGIDFRGFKAHQLSMRFDAPPYFNQYSLVAKSDLEHAQMTQQQRDKTTGINAVFPLGNIFNKNATGFGFDLGFTYSALYVKSQSKKIDSILTNNDEVIKQPAPPVADVCCIQYKYKISASLLDFGYINYGKDMIEGAKLNTNDKVRLADWHNNLFAKAVSYNTLINLISQDLVYDNPNDKPKVLEEDVVVYLPARLHVDIDFPITLKNKSNFFRNTFVNVAYNQNLIYGVRNGYANRMFSNFSITPRYQVDKFDIGIPITTYSDIDVLPFIFNLGIGARYKIFANANLYLGSSNILTFIPAINNQYSNVYFGVAYNVPYYCPPPPIDTVLEADELNNNMYGDDDKDKVPNLKDKCPTVAGSVKNFGCPIDSEYYVNEQIAYLSSILQFIPNQPVLQPSSAVALDTLKKFLVANSKVKLLLYGKADSFNTGKYEIENQLALSRDSVLKKELQALHIDTNQIIHIAVRPEQPYPNELPIISKYYRYKDNDRDGQMDSLDRCPTLIGIITEDGCASLSYVDPFATTTTLGNRIAFWKGLKDFAYDSEKYLQDVADIMNKEKDVKILVRAFVGEEILTSDFKYELSQRRADNIKAELVKLGVEPYRIIALGLSPIEPYNSVPMLMSIFNKQNLDIDFDKVLDIADRCPTLKGLTKFEGCPDSTVANDLFFLDSLSKLIEFQNNKEFLKPQSALPLLELYNYLISHPNATIAISPGIVSYELTNQQKDNLSNKRAITIKTYLENLGIPPHRLISRGLGYQQPIKAVALFTQINSRLLDSDLDEVKDYEDKCPTVKGTISYFGCPQINDEDLDFLARMNRNIIFEPNSADLVPASIPYVDSIVRFLFLNPNVEIVTSGNVANAKLDKKKQNLINDQRAELLSNYLTANGISKNRVKAVGLSYLEKTPWLTPSIRINESLTDIDADLVRDFYDKCPTTVGSAYNFGCPLESADIRETLDDVNSKLLFDLDQYVLRPKAIKALKNLIPELEKNSNLIIMISGHADTTGKKEHNLTLSLNRAKAVRDYILKNSKTIKSTRIIPLGMGDEFPVSNNQTIIGREQNRRVYIYMVD